MVPLNAFNIVFFVSSFALSFTVHDEKQQEQNEEICSFAFTIYLLRVKIVRNPTCVSSFVTN